RGEVVGAEDLSVGRAPAMEILPVPGCLAARDIAWPLHRLVGYPPYDVGLAGKIAPAPARRMLRLGDTRGYRDPKLLGCEGRTLDARGANTPAASGKDRGHEQGGGNEAPQAPDLRGARQ